MQIIEFTFHFVLFFLETRVTAGDLCLHDHLALWPSCFYFSIETEKGIRRQKGRYHSILSPVKVPPAGTLMWGSET